MAGFDVVGTRRGVNQWQSSMIPATSQSSQLRQAMMDPRMSHLHCRSRVNGTPPHRLVLMICDLDGASLAVWPLALLYLQSAACHTEHCAILRFIIVSNIRMYQEPQVCSHKHVLPPAISVSQRYSASLCSSDFRQH